MHRLVCKLLFLRAEEWAVHISNTLEIETVDFAFFVLE